jgi:hypothetical protein
MAGRGDCLEAEVVKSPIGVEGMECVPAGTFFLKFQKTDRASMQMRGTAAKNARRVIMNPAAVALAVDS